MPNFARQLRAASGQVGQGRPSSSSFRSLNEDDDLHLSSHEISDHQHDDYAAAECDHRPLPPDSNVDGAYDYQFAIAPQDQQHHHHQQQQHTQTRQQARQPKKKNNHQRHKRNKYQDNPQHEQELTGIPLTHMNSTDHILDHTFGDSLQSLSESLSNLDADVANEEELALRIIEEAAAAQRYDSDSGHDGGRRRQRRRAMLGCCSIIVGIIVMSALVGQSRSRKANAATSKDDPLGLLSQEPDDTISETDVWERVCSAHSVSSADGRHQCADACRIYDCCAADDGGDDDIDAKDPPSSSCADRKRDDCERFWRLCPDVLEIPVDLSSSGNPQRTSNWEQQQLIQACGEANTNTAKFDICNDLCADHLCCLDMYGGGCVKLKEYQCHLYREPCSVLAIDLAQAIAKHVGEDHNEKVEGGGRHNLR